MATTQHYSVSFDDLVTRNIRVVQLNWDRMFGLASPALIEAAEGEELDRLAERFGITERIVTMGVPELDSEIRYRIFGAVADAIESFAKWCEPEEDAGPFLNAPNGTLIICDRIIPLRLTNISVTRRWPLDDIQLDTLDAFPITADDMFAVARLRVDYWGEWIGKLDSYARQTDVMTFGFSGQRVDDETAKTPQLPETGITPKFRVPQHVSDAIFAKPTPSLPDRYAAFRSAVERVVAEEAPDARVVTDFTPDVPDVAARFLYEIELGGEALSGTVLPKDFDKYPGLPWIRADVVDALKKLGARAMGRKP